MHASTAFLTGRYARPGPARPAGHSVCAGDGTRVTSRVFTALRWLLATFDRTPTCDVTVISGLSLVYQYDAETTPICMTTKEGRKKQERKKKKTRKKERKKKVERPLLYKPVSPYRHVLSCNITEQIMLNSQQNQQISA